MSRSNISFDTKQLKELERELNGFITDEKKSRATQKGADKLKENLQNTAPYKTGELKEGMKVKEALNGGHVVTNDAESEPDKEGKTHRYGWILEHSEDKGHLGWFSRECDASEDEIEEILAEEILKQLEL